MGSLHLFLGCSDYRFAWFILVGRLRLTGIDSLYKEFSVSLDGTLKLRVGVLESCEAFI